MTKRDKDDGNKHAIHMGFPNSAIDSADIPLDLNKLVVKNRSSTFYMRVESDSWEEMDIHSGDLLTIDRALVLRSGDIFVGATEGEFVIRKFEGKKDGEVDFFGVITHVIRQIRK